MSKKVHGHDVLEMVLASPVPFTEASLEKAILAKFGDEARFYTCSAENMTAREIIAFLNQRGKFIQSGSGFTTAPEKICGHEGHHHD